MFDAFADAPTSISDQPSTSRTLADTAGAVHLRVPASVVVQHSREALCQWLHDEIASAYAKLRNHRFLSITVEFPDELGARQRVWPIIADATVFAERLLHERPENGFFRPREIAEHTMRHMVGTDPQAADFAVYQHGLAFKDCFLITSEGLNAEPGDAAILSAILLFEKNVADETRVPCPACGSLDVRGNSYPELGVKSWERQNLLCPERSAFDRGNRFTPASLERARFATASEAKIPVDHLKKWKLDVCGPEQQPAIFEMLVRHFSAANDEVLAVNWENNKPAFLGRSIRQKSSSP